MYDMMIATSTGVLSPLTPSALHPTDLSPRSSGSSSLLSDSHGSPSPTSARDHQLSHHQLLQALHGSGVEDLSPLQRLQFAIERNSVFSNLFHGEEGRGQAGERPVVAVKSQVKVAQEPQQQKHFVPSPGVSPNADPANIFQCPLCSIVCNGRHSFNEHLVTHSQHHACPKCDYLTGSEEKLRDHVQEVHDIMDPDLLDDDDASVPKVNSQGKVKTFKCKQCEHVSVTKSEFWAHSKSHIRSEKMLNCPKCPFVTEYKHHLEYHLRNHFGSKPFVCTKCPYTCVNKSMLNSHLKSHSNVYQYRCSDCSYATKYCHSLKLHLRKYNHNPSMVLNPDGTPNPLPIIDVYGTRRGPKMKRTPTGQGTPTAKPPKVKKVPSKNNNNLDGGHSGHSVHSNSSGSSFGDEAEENTRIPVPSPLSLSQKRTHVESAMSTPPLKRFASDTSDSDNETRRRLAEVLPSSPITPPNSLHGLQSMDNTKAVLELAAKNPLELYAAALNQYLFTNPLLQLSSAAQEHQGKILSQFLASQAGLNVNAVQQQHNQSTSIQNNQSPLDLRNPRAEPEKRKRKGKALRYERQQQQAAEESLQALDFSNNNNNNNNNGKTGTEYNYTIPHGPPSTMICKYCEIAFPDRVLYSMHMSYHSGDSEPFLCKSCGKRTPDKVGFFLHLTTDSH